MRSLSTCVRGRQGTCLNQKKKEEEGEEKKNNFNSLQLKKEAGRWREVHRCDGDGCRLESRVTHLSLINKH